MFNTIRFKIWWLKCNIPMYKWRFWHWVFRWNLDEDGDIVFSICKRIHFVKYKQSTLIQYGKRNYKEAPKRLTDEIW